MSIYSNGAITPSLAFSATVSTAALVTPSAVRFWVSRPTIRLTALRAAGRSPFTSSLCTFMLSCARPFAASACPHQNICTASPSHGLSFAAPRQTRPVHTKVPTGRQKATMPPPSSSPWGVLGRRARRRFSSAEMALPMSTTGWGSHAGSPKRVSSTKPPRTANPVIRRPPWCTARSLQGAAPACRPSRRRPAQSRPRWGRTIRSSLYGAGRSAPTRPSGCRRGPG